jgi:hypothetical protein
MAATRVRAGGRLISGETCYLLVPLEVLVVAVLLPFLLRFFLLFIVPVSVLLLEVF